MRIYIAAPWKHKADARDVAARVRAAGFVVTSRWFDNEYDAGVYKAPDQIMHDEAMKDVEDVSAADALIYLNMAKSEGKATELGMAIAMGMLILVIGGKDNNVFLHSDYVEHVNDLDVALARLKELA